MSATSSCQRLLCRPVSAVDPAGADQDRRLQAAFVRARHQLWLFPHRLCDPRTGDREGDRQAAADVMRERIFVPLGLRDTDSPATAEICRRSCMHSASERRAVLGIAPSTRFYEESTYWNPSWTTAPGAVQTTDIYDMITTRVAVGTGSLLSPESHQAQVAPDPSASDRRRRLSVCRTLDRSATTASASFSTAPGSSRRRSSAAIRRPGVTCRRRRSRSPSRRPSARRASTNKAATGRKPTTRSSARSAPISRLTSRRRAE